MSKSVTEQYQIKTKRKHKSKHNNNNDNNYNNNNSSTRNNNSDNDIENLHKEKSRYIAKKNCLQQKFISSDNNSSSSDAVDNFKYLKNFFNTLTAAEEPLILADSELIASNEDFLIYYKNKNQRSNNTNKADKVYRYNNNNYSNNCCLRDKLHVQVAANRTAVTAAAAAAATAMPLSQGYYAKGALASKRGIKTALKITTANDEMLQKRQRTTHDYLGRQHSSNNSNNNNNNTLTGNSSRFTNRISNYGSAAHSMLKNATHNNNLQLSFLLGESLARYGRLQEAFDIYAIIAGEHYDGYIPLDRLHALANALIDYLRQRSSNNGSSTNGVMTKKEQDNIELLAGDETAAGSTLAAATATDYNMGQLDLETTLKFKYNQQQAATWQNVAAASSTAKYGDTLGLGGATGNANLLDLHAPTRELRIPSPALSDDYDALMCPLCRDVLRCPVTTNCGHTFCRQCCETITMCNICHVKFPKTHMDEFVAAATATDGGDDVERSSSSKTEQQINQQTLLTAATTGSLQLLNSNAATSRFLHSNIIASDNMDAANSATFYQQYNHNSNLSTSTLDATTSGFMLNNNNINNSNINFNPANVNRLRLYITPTPTPTTVTTTTVALTTATATTTMASTLPPQTSASSASSAAAAAVATSSIIAASTTTGSAGASSTPANCYTPSSVDNMKFMPDVLVRRLVEKWWGSDLQAKKINETAASYMHLNLLDDALKFCNASLEKSPTNFKSLLLRAEVLRKLNHFQSSLADVDNALKTRYTSAKAHYLRALSLSELGRSDEALYDNCLAISLDKTGNLISSELFQHDLIKNLQKLLAQSAKSKLAATHRTFSTAIPYTVLAEHRLRRKKMALLSNANGDHLSSFAEDEDDFIGYGRHQPCDIIVDDEDVVMLAAAESEALDYMSCAGNRADYADIVTKEYELGLRRPISRKHFRRKWMTKETELLPTMALDNSRCSALFRSILQRTQQEIQRLEELEASGESPYNKHAQVPVNLIDASDFDCVLCCRTFWKPVVTPCGHTYCWVCLDRCMDYKSPCPLCMSPLVEPNVNMYQGSSSPVPFILAKRPVTKFLEAAMKRFIPDSYDKRFRQEMDMEPSVPVFICTTAFPYVPCPLFVYEPRYRLMVRRALESGEKQFGIVQPHSGKSRYFDVGTILDIRDCVLLGNGCSILSTIGCKRFKILARNEKDGYETAKVEYINDEIISDENVKFVSNMHAAVLSKAIEWFESLSTELKQEILQSFGEMPPVEDNWESIADGPAWAWWIIALLPLNQQLKVDILATTSLEKRLRAIEKTLDYMSGTFRRAQQNCSVVVVQQQQQQHQQQQQQQQEQHCENTDLSYQATTAAAAAAAATSDECCQHTTASATIHAGSAEVGNVSAATAGRRHVGPTLTRTNSEHHAQLML